MAVRATKAAVGIDSARQLELLDDALAESERARDGLVVANDRLRHSSAEPAALPAGRTKSSTPSSGTQVAAGRSPLARPSAGRRRPLPRLSVSPGEAAEMLGVSRDFFDKHIKPELRIIRRGSKTILIPVNELERWVHQSASRYSA